MGDVLSLTESQEIDGVVYHVAPLPGGASMRMTARLLKMVGPAFSDLPTLISAASAARERTVDRSAASRATTSASIGVSKRADRRG